MTGEPCLIPVVEQEIHGIQNEGERVRHKTSRTRRAGKFRSRIANTGLSDEPDNFSKSLAGTNAPTLHPPRPLPERALLPSKPHSTHLQKSRASPRREYEEQVVQSPSQKSRLTTRPNLASGLPRQHIKGVTKVKRIRDIPSDATSDNQVKAKGLPTTIRIGGEEFNLPKTEQEIKVEEAARMRRQKREMRKQAGERECGIFGEMNQAALPRHGGNAYDGWL